jgi:hypothetical protein
MDIFDTILENKIKFEAQQNRYFSIKKFYFYSFLMILRITFNFNFKIKSKIQDEVLFLNWSRYNYLYDNIPLDGTNLSFNYRDSSYKNLLVNINFLEIISILFEEFFKLNTKNKVTRCFYKLEYLMLKNYILRSNAKSIYINSLYDRYSYCVEFICKELDIKFNIVQHGALTKFNLTNHHSCNEFWLLFKHSKDLINSTFKVNEFKYLNVPSKIISDETFSRFVSYGTTPGKDSENQLVIETLISLFKTIIIYPHPRDIFNYSTYKDSLIFNNIRYKTDLVFVCGLSTLGVEYLESGSNVIFYNPENRQTDFSNYYKNNFSENINNLIYKCRKYSN